MTHLQQKHHNGCVVACLSMITGISYDDIVGDFTGDRTREGLSCFEYDVWLGYKGFAVIRRYKHYAPLHADRQEWPCEPFADVHLVTVRTPNSHAVVLLRDGTVLDPARTTPSSLKDYSGVDAITGIYKVGDPTPMGPLTYLHWSDGNRKCIWCRADVDSYQYHDPCPARNNFTNAAESGK